MAQYDNTDFIDYAAALDAMPPKDAGPEAIYFWFCAWRHRVTDALTFMKIAHTSHGATCGCTTCT